jgi:hypothetical protein
MVVLQLDPGLVVPQHDGVVWPVSRGREQSVRKSTAAWALC